MMPLYIIYNFYSPYGYRLGGWGFQSAAVDVSFVSLLPQRNA